MPVTFDAVGPSSAGAAAPNAASLSWSHTASGTFRLVIVVCAAGKGIDTGVALTATYGGVSMTSLGLIHSNNSNAGFVQMWGLIAPATGAQTVVVTNSGPTADLEGGSVSFNGVNQTTAWQNVATAFGNSTAPSVSITSSSGNMVIDGVANGQAITSSGQTNRWLKNQNSTTAAGNAASSTASGAGSVTMSYTVTSDWWGIIGADIIADSGGGGGGTATRGDIFVVNQSVIRGSTW